MSDGDEGATWLKRLSGWPLVGRLWEVPPDAMKEARKEVLSATFYSTMPFWFPVVGVLIFTGKPAIWDTIVEGGLFIYAAAILGPLGYIVTKRHGRFKIPSEIDENEERSSLSYRFPAMQETFYFASIVCILSGVALTARRFIDPESPQQIINESGVAVLSIIVAIGATFLLFCVTAYRNMMEVIERQHSELISSSLKDATDHAFDEWLDRKGQ
jgi:uncharacterized membrane protein YhaH (DUF805 family)